MITSTQNDGGRFVVKKTTTARLLRRSAFPSRSRSEKALRTFLRLVPPISSTDLLNRRSTRTARSPEREIASRNVLVMIVDPCTGGEAG